MKNYLTSAMLFLFALAVGSLYSQEKNYDLDSKIPFDSKVLKGKLDNGLTYYIRHNEKPEGKVELRLVVNAGSILEDSAQQGLAHFVEHMCFNGTEHFKKNELVSFLQSLGIEFGGDLNAYTSFDETVYMLPVPSEDLDTGLLVLRDWAGAVTFEDEEIDKERGVILEELRLGRGAQQRMRDKYFPTLFKNSRYAERLAIGKKEIIETFRYDTLRNFYKEWYRPELQAVIVVGDIDPETAEKEIIKKFSDLKMPEKYRKRVEYPVPDHQDTYVKVVSDKEAPYTIVQIYYKDDTSGIYTWGDYKEEIAQNLFNGMLNNRLQELTQQADPPFMFGSSGYGPLVRTKNTFSSFAVVGPDGIEKGMKALLEENQRVKKYGFTQTELDRYKDEYLKRLEKAFKEKGKTESVNYVGEYQNNYLENVPSPGIEEEYEFTEKVLPEITLEDVNKYAKKWIKDYNRVVIVSAPEKEGVALPTEKEVYEWVVESDSNTPEAYVDNVSDRPLMAEIPTEKRVVSEKEYKKTGIKEFVLENGAKVVIKPTDFKDDEILFSSYSFGGTSMFPDNEYRSAGLSANIVIESGVNGFSNIELEKLLSGKNVRVNPYVYKTRQGITGNSTPSDFETALQLINLYYTKPNFDETAFKSLIKKQKMILSNLLEDPNYYFNDKVKHILANNHPRGDYMITIEDLDKISLEQAKKAYEKMFGNALNYTFFFTGNVDLEKDLPLIKKYIGSLPAGDEKLMYKDLGIRPPKGPLKKTVYKGVDPKSQVRIYYLGETKFSPENNYLMGSLGEVLTIKLLENLREKKSGVYGVGAGGYLRKIPYSAYVFSLGFPCGPENVDSLTVAAYNEVQNLISNGPEKEDVEKVKATQMVHYKENIQSNNYWLSSMMGSWINGQNIDDILKQPDRIKSLNAKKLKKIAGKYLTDKSRIEIVLMPENYEKN